MPFRRDDRFSHDVGEIRSDGKIPIKTNRLQRRARDEAPAYAEKSTEDSNNKPDHRQVDRADVRIGDWEKHRLLRTAAAEESQQPGGDALEKDGLADDQ